MSEIIKALVEARKACHATVYKGGENSMQKYKYVGHEHVLASGARSALLDHGLVLEQASVEFLGELEYQTRNGKNSAWRWRGVHKLVHVSGEEREYVFEATTGPNDKSAFVASTALDRTAHLRIMQLAGSAEENPEHDSNEQQAANSKRKEAKPARTLDDVAGAQEAPERPLGEAGQQRTTPSRSAEEKGHGVTREGWELLFDGGPEDQWGLAMPNCEAPVFSQKSRFAGKSWSDPSVSGAVFARFLEDGADEMTSVQRAWAEYRMTERQVRKSHEAKRAKEQSNG